MIIKLGRNKDGGVQEKERWQHKNQIPHSISQHPRLLPWRGHCNKAIPDSSPSTPKVIYKYGKRTVPRISSDRGANHLCSQIPTSKVKILLCFSFVLLEPACNILYPKVRTDPSSFLELKGEKCILTKPNRSSIKDPLSKF